MKIISGATRTFEVAPRAIRAVKWASISFLIFVDMVGFTDVRRNGETAEIETEGGSVTTFAIG